MSARLRKAEMIGRRWIGGLNRGSRDAQRPAVAAGEAWAEAEGCRLDSDECTVTGTRIISARHATPQERRRHAND